MENEVVTLNSPEELRVLITGGTGFVGRRMIRLLRSRFPHAKIMALGNKKQIDIEGVKSKSLDLLTASHTEIEKIVTEFRPNWLIQLVALTAFAPPPEQYDAYRKLNTEIPCKLLSICQEASKGSDFRAFYASTDMVFDGYHAPYSPSDPPNPTNFYGQTKAEAESLLKGKCLIGRFPLLYGLGGGFFQVIYDTLAKGEPIDLLCDEFRSVAWATDVARIVIEMMVQYESLDKTKIWNIGGPARVSRYELGRALAHHCNFDLSLVREALSKDIIKGPPRPPDLTLISDETYNTLGLKEDMKPKPVFEGVRLAIQEGIL